MFKFAKNAEFTHDVPVQLPCDNGFADEMLRTRFRKLSKAEMSRYTTVTTVEEQIEFLSAVVVRFENVVDDNNEPITDADQLKRDLLEDPAVRLALSLHYNLAMVGGRRKN